MLIYLLQSNPQVYFMIVITIIASIVLHELAHGVAAIWQGDRTPIYTGHMTLNPIVHMGWVSIILAVIVGIAWGAMPVNRSHFRSRHGDAIVSLAGPAMNVLIALILATVFAVILSFYGDIEPATPKANAMKFLQLASTFNLVLAAFNLMPIPPLDGSRILANFHPPFGRWIDEHPQASTPMMLGLMLLMSALADTAYSPFLLATRVFVRYVDLWA